MHYRVATVADIPALAAIRLEVAENALTDPGRGIGKELLSLAVDWLFDQGAETISLSTDPGTRADKLYQSVGWERGEHIANGEVRFRLTRR